MPAETAIDALVELRDGLVALGENPERLTELHNGPYVRAVRHAAKMRDDEHRTRVEAVGTVLITAMLAEGKDDALNLFVPLCAVANARDGLDAFLKRRPIRPSFFPLGTELDGLIRGPAGSRLDVLTDWLAANPPKTEL